MTIQSTLAQSKIDSLKTLLASSKKEDSTKVIRFNLLAKSYLNNYPDSIYYYANKANILAKKINFNSGLAESNRHLGTYFYFNGDVEKSLAYLDSSLTIFKKEGNLRGEMSVYNNLGLVQKNIGDFKNAIKNYNLALSGNRSLNDSTAMLNNLINFANANSSIGKYELAEDYFAEALTIGTAINNASEIANIYSGFGILEERKGNFEKAIKLHQQAIEYYQEKNFLSNISITYNNIANIERKRGDYISSIHYFEEALLIAKQIDRRRLQFILLNNIANNYLEINDLDQALEYYNQSIEINQKTDLFTHYASISNIAQIKLDYQEYDKAEEYFREVIDFYEEEEITHELVNVYNNLSSTYIERGELEKAESYLKKSVELGSEGNHDYYLTATYTNLAKLEYLRENYVNAINYGQLGYNLSQQVDAKQRIVSAAEILANSFKQIGDFQNALKYFEIYKQASDELFNAEKSKELGRIEAEKEFEAEKERIQLQNEKILIEKDAKIRERTLITIISIVVLCAMLLFSLVLYVFRKREQKNNLQLQKANENIENQNKRLKALHVQKNKLFSIVAHDLRGPLNTLNGMFELLASGDIDDEEVNSLLPEVNKHLESTILLTNNLLDWAGQEMKESKKNKESINLNETTNNLKQLFNVSLTNKNISFIVSISPETFINYNKQVLILVLRNLISNAVKYCNYNDQIIISGSFNEDSSVYKICVEDSGVGMTEEVKNRLFSNKVDSKSGTQNERGTGLGLILSKDFVEQNGGEIWVEYSQINEGTKICFTTPQ